MKRFKYNFEKLLSIKEHFENIAKLEYASVLQKKINYETENNKLKSEINDLILKTYKSDNVGDILNYQNINMIQEYITNSISKMEINDNKKEELKEELFEKFEKLKQATKEKKIFEELKNKKFKKYKKEIKKIETKETDDIAGRSNYFKKLYKKNHKEKI